MPIPKGDVGEIIHFSKKEKPNMPQKQKVAIALSIQRKRKKFLKKAIKRKDGIKNGLKKYIGHHTESGHY